MAWLNRDKAPLVKSTKKNIPEGLWEKCHGCNEVLFTKDLQNNLNVCPKCSYHYYLPLEDRINLIADKSTFEEYNADLKSIDPLLFVDTKPYKQRLEEAIKKNKKNDAIVTGTCKVEGLKCHLGVFDFKFLGGSMGSVVGEKITKLFEYAAKHNEPAIIVSASGGARMHEGIISLMQMSKTCAALAVLKDKGIPYISIMTDPTTGGVAASFAMLGDINIAEPGALIGFAGPRVIEQTIRQALPEGFQKSEYLLEHGMIDRICHRHELKSTVANILKILCQKN